MQALGTAEFTYCPLEADVLLLTYYRLVLALIQGTTCRPSLPTELVLHILQFAQLASPHPTKRLSSKYTCNRPIPAPLHHGLFRMGRLALGVVPLMRTPPLPRAVERIEIVVKYVGDCRHVTTSVWGDFFIRIIRPDEEDLCTVMNMDGSEMRWPCFESSEPVSNHIGGNGACERRRVLDWSDQKALSNWLKPGDRLEVAVQTYAGEGQVDKFDGVVRVYDRWEPSLVTLGSL